MGFCGGAFERGGELRLDAEGGRAGRKVEREVLLAKCRVGG